jgi:hypothetical protein
MPEGSARVFLATILPACGPNCRYSRARAVVWIAKVTNTEATIMLAGEMGLNGLATRNMAAPTASPNSRKKKGPR